MKNMYDLIIIGAGVAGLSAAVYAGHAKLKVLVIEKTDTHGIIKIAPDFTNAHGAFSEIGAGMVAQMKRQALHLVQLRKQAMHFGAIFNVDEVRDVDFSKDIKEVNGFSGETYYSLGVIIATGTKPETLGFVGEKEFAGRGIAYSASCDGDFFVGKDVFVIGNGNNAAGEAMLLTYFAKKVTIIANTPRLNCSKAIADSVLSNKKIDVKFNTDIVHVRGTNLVKEVMFINNQTAETWTHKVTEGTFGVFVFAGHLPESDIFSNHTEIDSSGYIMVDKDMHTNVSGICAAGEVRSKESIKFVNSATDGAIAATSIQSHIIEARQNLGTIIYSDNFQNQDAEKYGILYGDTSKQIQYVMERCQGEVSIQAILKPNCKVSLGIRNFLDEFASITDRVSISIQMIGENPMLENEISSDAYPIIALMGENGAYSGVGYAGIPGGHELESFVLAIYNIAGPGQAMSDNLRGRIRSIDKSYNFKIGVSLTCPICPELVQVCQRVAILNNNITAEMLDLQHYPELRNRHDIMSVPALIINDKDVLFGKKSIEEIVGYLECMIQNLSANLSKAN
ncbi:MAG: FAD-dependent oxidoreductase [Defluviitaleaceae bacterium]|nr:FAD-dependent oxidoreductase [Defluviitaleaceae bacterium]